MMGLWEYRWVPTSVHARTNDTLSPRASVWIFFSLFRLHLSLYSGTPGGKNCLYRGTLCCLAFKFHFSKQFLKKDPLHHSPEYLLIQDLQRRVIFSSSQCGDRRRGWLFAEAQNPFRSYNSVPSHVLRSSCWKPSPVWTRDIAGCLCSAISQVHIKRMVLLHNPDLISVWFFNTRPHTHSAASYWDLFTVL